MSFPLKGGDFHIQFLHRPGGVFVFVKKISASVIKSQKKRGSIKLCNIEGLRKIG